MYKRLSHILSLAFALTSFVLPTQAAPDINIDEDVAEEPAKATAYRYWIDDNTDKTEVALNGEDIESNIDVSALTIGVHIYHIQLKDQNDRWGTTTDIPFYAGYENTETKEDDSTIPPVEKIIYWIDDDYDNQVTQAYTGADISLEKDFTNMASSRHSFSLIAINSQNHVAVTSGSFYVLNTDGSDEDSGEKEVTTIETYQYWVDDDKDNAKTLPYASDDMSLQIDYSQMAEGLHTLHFRMKNNEGMWSSYEYPFYTPETNNTEQAETAQPITGYRYGVNGKSVTKTITEVESVPSLNIEIPIPSFHEILRVEDYEFTADNTTNNVKVKRNGKLTYYIQFRNKLGEWSEPAFVDSLASDSTIRTANDLAVNRTLGIRKLSNGDYNIAKFSITDDNGYYLGASEPCNVMLYQDNKRLNIFTPEQMTGNKSNLLTSGTYFAIIYNQDEDGSIRLASSNNWVSDPTFSYSDHQLSMACESANAQIHYTMDGSMPTSESPVYTGPITMTYNAKVKAIALCDGMADSFIKSFDVNDFETQTCTKPQFVYDGRKVTLSSDIANANIYYTEDGSTPSTEEAQLYNGESIDIKGLGSVKAIVTKDLMNNSEVATYEIPAYYDGKSQVEVKTAGNLSKAFEWNNGEVNSDTLQVLGNINTSDVTSLRAMADIKYLDLNKVSVEGNTLPDQAFADMNLRTASLPATLTSCGSSLFAGNIQLAAVMWNANMTMPAEVISGIDNPNLLLYVNTKSYASASVNNVVAGGIADNIVLSEPSTEQASAGNFFAPQAFTAKKISYTRNFKQETEIGICQGWETIALPFEAQTITHETNGKIAPFAKGDKDARPFWLYKLASNGGFQATATLKANTPYIISMPNSQSYSDEYILGGKVTFAATDVTIAATEPASTKNSSREFVTSFEQLDKSNGIYALNVGQEYQGYRPGSIFAEDFIAVKPFEAYLTTAEAAAKFSRYFNHENFGTGIDAISTKQVADLKVWTSGSSIYIQSGKACRVQVFSTTGMLVKSIDVAAGETTTVSGMPAGIYIVNKKKVTVK